MQTTKVGVYASPIDGTIFDVIEVEAGDLTPGTLILSGLGWCVAKMVDAPKVNRHGVTTVHVFTENGWDKFFTGKVRTLVEQPPR